MLKHVPAFAIFVLLGPVLAGLLGTALPALGILPSLGGTHFTLEHFVAVVTTPGIYQSSLTSLYVGLITTLVSLVVVMLVIAGWQGTRFFSALQGVLSPLLSVPHAAAAFGLAFLIAPSGWIVRLLSPWMTGFTRPPDWLIVNDTLGLSMMAGLIAKEIPFLLLMTLAALPQSDAKRKAHIAASLGYGPVTGFFKTTFPIVYTQIRLPVFAVLAYATSVVDVAIILGPTTPPPLSVRLLQWMNDPEISMRFQASAGAQLQLAITALALLIWLGFEWLGKIFGRPLLSAGKRQYGDAIFRSSSAIIAITFAMMIIAGIIVLGLWSVSGFWRFPDLLPKTFTTATWMRQSNSLGLPLQNAIIIGLSATAIAISLTLSCLEMENRTGKTLSGKALLMLYLPLIVPQISFLFGLQVLFLQIGSNANMIAVVLAHVVFVFPYVYLSLADPWAAWDKRYATLAHGLGHSSNSVFWRVRIPMMLTPVLTAAAVGFSVSIGQYLATLLIGGGRIPTITTEAVALSSGGDRRVIGVYALVQTLLPFIGFGLALAIPAFAYRNRRGLREHA